MPPCACPAAALCDIAITQSSRRNEREKERSRRNEREKERSRRNEREKERSRRNEREKERSRRNEREKEHCLRKAPQEPPLLYSGAALLFFLSLSFGFLLRCLLLCRLASLAAAARLVVAVVVLLAARGAARLVVVVVVEAHQRLSLFVWLGVLVLVVVVDLALFWLGGVCRGTCSVALPRSLLLCLSSPRRRGGVWLVCWSSQP